MSNMFNSWPTGRSDKTFVYGGRRNKGNALFSAEEVAMYTESSAGYAGFKKSCKFPFRTSMLPYWSEAWRSAAKYHHRRCQPLGVDRSFPDRNMKAWPPFLIIISTPAVQADWHQFTGYLPITTECLLPDQRPGRL